MMSKPPILPEPTPGDVGSPAKKKSDLSAPYLKWLIHSRMRNQSACLKLFDTFETYPEQAKSTAYRNHSQTLVAAGFSLWRAAFLADKTGEREAVFADARAFLAELLTNNAINYSQDRASREWTFNYYMTSANDALLKLGQKWPEIVAELSRPRRVPKGSTNSIRRWNRHQDAFETALEAYERDLLKASEAPPVKPRARIKKTNSSTAKKPS